MINWTPLSPITIIYNAYAQPLFYSLDLLFDDVPGCRCRRGFVKSLLIIIENAEANKGILQSKFTDNVTNKTKTKTATWKAITEKVKIWESLPK